METSQASSLGKHYVIASYVIAHQIKVKYMEIAVVVVINKYEYYWILLVLIFIH